MRGLRSRVLAALLVVILMGSAGAGGSTGVMNERGPPEASPAVPAFFFWFLSVGTASCSLSTGVCTMAIANEGSNSSYDLVLAVDYCNLDLIYAKNSTVTYYTLANGTTGGQIMSGIPFGANVVATCTVPTTQLTLEPNGWTATGFFTMKLVNSLDSILAGRTAGVHFEGTWTASSATYTNTTTSTVTTTTPSVASTTAVESCTTISTGVVLCHTLSSTTSIVTTTATSPSTSNSTFAYVALGVAAIVILVVAALAAWVLKGRRP